MPRKQKPDLMHSTLFVINNLTEVIAKQGAVISPSMTDAYMNIIGGALGVDLDSFVGDGLPCIMNVHTDPDTGEKTELWRVYVLAFDLTPDRRIDAQFKRDLPPYLKRKPKTK